MAAVIAAVGAVGKEWGAADALKKGLYSLKVSKRDATEVERKLQGELLKTWKEKFQVARFTKIKKEDLKDFLNYLENAYEGVTTKVRRKMEGIVFSETLKDEIVENTFVAGGTSKAQYSLAAFGRSSDGMFLDCIYIVYEAEFELAPEEIETLKEHSMLCGLFNWVKYSTEEKKRNFGIETNKRFENYFRLKVLEELKHRNEIDSVTYEG